MFWYAFDMCWLFAGYVLACVLSVSVCFRCVLDMRWVCLACVFSALVCLGIYLICVGYVLVGGGYVVACVLSALVCVGMCLVRVRVRFV